MTGVLLIAGGIGYGLVEQASYEQDAQRQTSDYAKHAAAKIQQTCADISKAEKARCLSDAKTEYELEARKSRHDAADLVAQRKSALWASIMGVAALIGMALSAVGVILVWTTFKETQRTNLINMRDSARATRRSVTSARETAAALEISATNANTAARTAQAAVDSLKGDRAWVIPLQIDLIMGEGNHWDGELIKKGIGFRVVWKNHGRTPAKQVEIILAQQPWWKGGEEPAVDLPQWDEKTPRSIVAPNDTVSGSPFLLNEQNSRSFFAMEVAIKVRCFARYRDIISDEVHVTDMYMLFEFMGGTIQGKSGRPEPYINYGFIGPEAVLT